MSDSEMSNVYDVVYVSPHLDDAALSCGGQIAARSRAGESVLVLTLFTADEPPPPHSQLVSTLHRVFGLDSGAVERRRGEDMEACGLLGAEARHAGLPEAVYRRDPEEGTYLYRSFRELFGAPLPDDRAVLEALTEVLAALPEATRVLAPLGVGGHVDHRLTRSAAEMACHHLSFYEEIPYAEKWFALRRALGRRRDWEPSILPLEDADLDAKIAACSAYASQIEGLYKTPQRLDRAMRERARKLGGERVWRRV